MHSVEFLRRLVMALPANSLRLWLSAEKGVVARTTLAVLFALATEQSILAP